MINAIKHWLRGRKTRRQIGVTMDHTLRALDPLFDPYTLHLDDRAIDTLLRHASISPESEFIVCAMTMPREAFTRRTGQGDHAYDTVRAVVSDILFNGDTNFTVADLIAAYQQFKAGEPRSGAERYLNLLHTGSFYRR